MKKIYRVILFVKKFTENRSREHTGAFAAQTTLFLFMSYLPLLFLVVSFINKISPEIGAGILKRSVVRNINEKNFPYTAKSLVSVYGIFAAWSSGKAFKSLTEGLHAVLRICESRNYLLSRIRGLVYAVVFSVVSGLLILTGVFGESFLGYLHESFPEFSFGFWLIKLIRILIAPTCIFVMHFLLYRFVPDWSKYVHYGKKRIKLNFIACGAVISTLSIYIYTFVFRLWIGFSSSYGSVYTSATTIVFLMLWLYVSMYIMICGFKIALILNTRFNEK